MENPCKLIFFGDSIIKAQAPRFEKQFRVKYPEVEITIINAGFSGETSRNGLKRLPQLIKERPNVVVIGFGMNDWRKGIDLNEYKNNLIQMLEGFENIGARVIINTLSPSYDFKKLKYNSETERFSNIVREIAYEKRIKIADINALWKRELKKLQKGLRDDIHPNATGYDIICKSLMWVVPRKNTTILWQYNGREAKCNYRCPYCYYIGLHSPKDRFFGTIEQWHSNFKEAFGKQDLIFYLSYGEPTYGDKFPEILKMVDNEKNWEIRITSNVSYNLERIVRSKAAQEGRLNINASFHPCMIKRDKFLNRILFLRENGIEVPIVYVAYPVYLKHFEEDINFFTKKGFVVHVRRFQGLYKNKNYPSSYTQEETRLIAKYSDDGTIKYMLNQQSFNGCPTFTGLHFFIIDNVGNVGYDANIFHPYSKYRTIFGNIHSNNFKPMLEPSPYPGNRVGTVDGIANIVKNNYNELENNNVLSFARQGGVYNDEKGKIIYSNVHKDFDDPKIRLKYNFPLQLRTDSLNNTIYSIFLLTLQRAFKKTSMFTRKILRRYPKLKNMLKSISSKIQ